MVDDSGPRGLPRRGILAGAAGAMLLCTGRGAAAPGKAAPGAPPRVREFRLTPREASVPIVGDGYPDTVVWAYDGVVPGPEIRVRQGDRVRVVVENRLAEETTVHWHGLRVPNGMDGVPRLTQPPIAPGESFVYEFDALDAGTFWYHPHARSFEQVERGLAGALVVEEAEPALAVDRDVTWVLDDWRLTRDAAVAGGFGGMMDASHAGRLGNTATINGRVPDAFPLRAGERLRLRLVNVANARVFGLEFQGHRPLVVALDGQPVEPHEPADGRVVLGPAQRVDLVLDATGGPGERFEVVDGFYARRRYRLVDLAYGGATPLRGAPPGPPAHLPPNPLPEPDLAGAVRHAVEFGGGMMDPKRMRGGGRDGGGMRGRMDGGDMGQMGDHGRMGREDRGGMDGCAPSRRLDHQRRFGRGRAPPARAGPGPGARPVLRLRHAQRDVVVAPDAPARPHLPGSVPQRASGAAPGVARHRADGARRTRGDRLRRRQPGRLDVPLPRPRAPSRRDDGGGARRVTGVPDNPCGAAAMAEGAR